MALALAGQAATTLPTLTPSATTLTFTYIKGGALPASQTLTVKGSASAKLTFTVAKSPDVDWLVVTPVTATTSASLIVLPNPNGLSVGVHQTTIVLTCSGASNSPVSVTVNLTVKNAVPALTVSPASATINYTTDDATFPAATKLALTTSGDPISFTAAVSGAAWLTALPTSGVTLQSSPATVSLTVNPTGLGPGTYTGKLTLTLTNATTKTQTVTVSLVVAAGTAVLSKVWPPTIGVGSLDTTITLTGHHLFSISSVHVGTADLTPIAIGSAADTLLVVVPKAQFASQASLPVTVTNAPRPASNALTLTVTAPGPQIWTVLNGASYSVPAASATPVVAPGEIVAVFGSGLGPDAGIAATVPSAGGAYATRLGTAPAETYIEFETDPVAHTWAEAPLIYAQDGQVNAVVPFAMPAGTGQKMRATYNGVTSTSFTVDVVAADPGIFTVNSGGTGQAAVLNFASGTYPLNSDKTPVVRGDIICIYATGGGMTTPAPTTEGELVPLGGALRHLVLEGNTSVTIGTETVAAAYAGAVPGSIAGLVQINATVPAEVKAGKAVPLLVTINGRTSPSGVTINVK
jgi:uncharacterized protein (TIGR03437 family)